MPIFGCIESSSRKPLSIFHTQKKAPDFSGDNTYLLGLIKNFQKDFKIRLSKKSNGIFYLVYY
jgi:hypothetical protein